MQFTEVDPKFIRNQRKTSTKVRQFIEDFIEANIYAAEVHWENNYNSVESARGSLKNSIDKNRLSHISLAVHRDKLYIFNELVKAKE